MGNNLPIQTLENFNKSKNLTLEEFQKQIPRKMIYYHLKIRRIALNSLNYLQKKKL